MGDHESTSRSVEEQMQQMAERMQNEMLLLQQRFADQMADELARREQQFADRLAEYQGAVNDARRGGERPLNNTNDGWVRLKVPKPKPYDGKTSTGAVENFLFDCEQYFKASLIIDESQKLLFATSMLEGIAKTWWRFQLEQAEKGYHQIITTWDEFVEELKGRFQIVNSVQNARDKLANLKQTGGVRGYVAQFQNLVMQIPDINEGEQLDKFVRGLRTKTRIEVRLRRPMKLDEAIVIAECYDSLLNEVTPGYNRPQGNRPQPVARAPFHQGARDGPAPMEIDVIRRIPLTPAERERLSRIGACFYCRQVGHMINTCPNRNGNRPRRVAHIDRTGEEIEGNDSLSENDESQ